MERRKFTREFKLEAVKLIRDRGVSYAQASHDLGVHPTQLRDHRRPAHHTCHELTR
jgi:transposase-like protein